MIRVKLTTSFPKEPILRQTPGGLGRWGDCQFFVNDNTEDCDWWAVFEWMDEPVRCRCPKQNRVFVCCEPRSLRSYNQAFLRQFPVIITTHTDIEFPGARHGQVGLPWHAGRNVDTFKVNQSYDDFCTITEFPKTKLLSIVCSSKRQSPGHELRLNFLERLMEKFGDRIDVFGRDINPVLDKLDAILPYKYHIAIENFVSPDYWTEKLADSFLGGAHPIYYGCSNLSDYFPERSYTRIDINKPKEALSIIEKTLRNDPFDESFHSLLEARRLILDKYNLFAMLDELIRRSPAGSHPRKALVVPEYAFSGRLHWLVSLRTKVRMALPQSRFLLKHSSEL